MDGTAQVWEEPGTKNHDCQSHSKMFFSRTNKDMTEGEGYPYIWHRKELESGRVTKLLVASQVVLVERRSHRKGLSVHALH